MKERLNKRYGIDVKIKTFHALGKEILENATENSKKGAPRLKFSGDNYEKESNRFMKTLFRKAQEDSELQNDLINCMKLYGDDEVIKKEVDFKTKEEYYRYMHHLTYTTLDGTKVKSEAEREIMNFFISRNLDGKKVKILYEQPAEWMKYSDEKGGQVPSPDFFFPDYDIYIGTIEKSSDFLIFHPSYPTFSSCLQIVNYHKVIPH